MKREFIAKASEGGMRDALSIMDKLSQDALSIRPSYRICDEHLTLQDALDVTGSVDEAALNELFKDVVDGNVKMHLHAIINLFLKEKKLTVL